MTVLSIEDLSLSLPSGREILRAVGLEVRAGETVGLVGESGSGKSTTARVALRLLPEGARVSGSVTVCGHEVVDASPATVREVRRDAAALIFQEPRAVLNPVRRIGDSATERLVHVHGVSKSEARARIADLFTQVGLTNPERLLRRYPHEMSGGMLQRVVIAAALSVRPRLLLVGLIRPDAGTVEIGGHVRTARERGRTARLRRAKEVQMVFQDPYGSLDRRLTVGAALRDVLRRHSESTQDRVAEVMTRVGLGAELLGSRPHQLSGGQRQRVAIAKALAVDPAVLVLDEATSALDVSVQAQILALLNEIRANLGVTLVFVTHDLAVVGQVTDDLLVMYRGSAVEQGATAEVLRGPKHPYTEMLLSSAPGPDWRPERVAELRAAFQETA